VSNASTSSENSNGDISLEGLLEEFDRQEMMQSKQLLAGFKLTFISSSDIILSSQSKRMMEMRTAVSIMIEKNDSKFKIDCQLTALCFVVVYTSEDLPPHQ
jgi:hypothetical protein